MKRLSIIIISLSCLFGFVACSEDSCVDDFPMKGKPIEFNFNYTDSKGITRGVSALDPSNAVYVTENEGTTWCKYVYDSENNIWKPASGETAIIWKEKEVTLFAIVRFDGQSPGTTAVSVNADQTSFANYTSSDFLGMRSTFSYTSGKITMTLKHRVAKLVVKANNCPTENAGQLLTCTTSAAFALNGAYSFGYSNIEFAPNAESTTSTIKLFRERKEGTTVYFSAYMFPIVGNTTTGLIFTCNGKTLNVAVTYNLSSGITLDSGCITQYEVFLP